MTQNKRYLIIIGLLMIVGLLPWFCHLIWETTRVVFVIRGVYLNLIIHFLVAILVGFLIFRLKIKLTILIPIILVLIATSLIWNINRFEENKQQYQNGSNAIHSEPDCYKEKNYKNYWDYINNGCHVTVSEVVLTLTYRILIWSLTIAIINYMLTRSQTSKKVDKFNLLD